MSREEQLPTQPGLPSHWPWQRSLQYRIIFTYTTIFAVVLLLLMVGVGQIIYIAQVDQAESHLELEAFLTANALEDPESAAGSAFRAFTQQEEELQDEDNGPKNNSASSTKALAQISLLTKRYANETRTRVTLLDIHGAALVDSEFLTTSVANQFVQVEVQAAIHGKEQHDIRQEPLTHTSMLYAAAPIREGESILGIIRLARPMSQVMANLQRLLMRLALAGLLTLLSVSLLGFWFSQRLVQPIKIIERVALAVGRGDLTQQVPVATDDELGALARAFNFMLNRLRQMIEQQQLFVANASHELRTPMTNIKLRAEALLNGGKDDPAVMTRYLTEIDSEADRLRRLATTLLDLAQLEANHTTRKAPEAALDLSDSLQTVIATMQWRAEQAGLTFTHEIAAPLPPLRIWPEHLEEILVNLIDNAIKFTPAGGTIRLTTPIANGTCRFQVSDSGPGIPADEIPYIFDRFYRVDKARSRRRGRSGVGSGAGLGLAIVKTLVEINNGKVWAENSVDQGASFVVEFPLATDA
jgi:signal transduction histidine kinase